MKKEIFTVPEIATICRVSRQTVFYWIKKGYIKAYRPAKNSAWKITRKEFISHMKKHDIPFEFLKDEKIKILVIDDEEVITSFILKSLKDEEKFEIETANSGFKAGMKLTMFNPDIIILDIILNDIDGRQLFQYIKEEPDYKEIKFIGISGKIDISEVQPLLSMGFNAFIWKPFKINIIRDTIYSLVNE